MMKDVQWVRFTWNLSELPPLALALPAHYHLGRVGAEEEAEVRAVVTRSFAHDDSWGNSIQEVNALVEQSLERFSASEEGVLCLALRHGVRMIGAALLVPDAQAENHLTPGPSVLMEYRNRGFGMALLGESLRTLREAGLTEAGGRARAHALVAKFLYPKFKGTPTPDKRPLLAA